MGGPPPRGTGKRLNGRGQGPVRAPADPHLRSPVAISVASMSGPIRCISLRLSSLACSAWTIWDSVGIAKKVWPAAQATSRRLVTYAAWCRVLSHSGNNVSHSSTEAIFWPFGPQLYEKRWLVERNKRDRPCHVPFPTLWLQIQLESPKHPGQNDFDAIVRKSSPGQ